MSNKKPKTANAPVQPKLLEKRIDCTRRTMSEVHLALQYYYLNVSAVDKDSPYSNSSNKTYSAYMHTKYDYIKYTFVLYHNKEKFCRFEFRFYFQENRSEITRIEFRVKNPGCSKATYYTLVDDNAYKFVESRLNEMEGLQKLKEQPSAYKVEVSNLPEIKTGPKDMSAKELNFVNKTLQLITQVSELQYSSSKFMTLNYERPDYEAWVDIDKDACVSRIFVKASFTPKTKFVSSKPYVVDHKVCYTHYGPSSSDPLGYSVNVVSFLHNYVGQIDDHEVYRNVHDLNSVLKFCMDSFQFVIRTLYAHSKNLVLSQIPGGYQESIRSYEIPLDFNQSRNWNRNSIPMKDVKQEFKFHE